MASSVNRVAAPSTTNECVWDGLAQSLRRVTVQIFGRGGNHGAGIVWRSDGMIVTNAHVVRGTSMIRLEDGRTHRAELVCAGPPARSGHPAYTCPRTRRRSAAGLDAPHWGGGCCGRSSARRHRRRQLRNCPCGTKPALDRGRHPASAR